MNEELRKKIYPHLYSISEEDREELRANLADFIECSIVGGFTDDYIDLALDSILAKKIT